VSEAGEQLSAISAAEYDRQWAQLQDFIRYNPGARHRRRLLERLVRRGDAPSTVLDAGCGLGEIVQLMHGVFPDAAITGVDISEVALESNARRFPFATFELLNIEQSKLDRVFDLVISSEVVEHLEDQPRAVAHLAEMVAPGGSLVVSVPAGKIFATERTFGHVRHPDLEWLRAAIEEHGLVVTDAFRWGFPTYLALKYVVNARPDMTMREFGWGTYGVVKRSLNDAIYYATFLNRMDSARGCQTFVRATRPAASTRAA
jgi:SAM-dependent methyltransferase